jgi:hypothetical protein
MSHDDDPPNNLLSQDVKLGGYDGIGLSNI